MKPPPFRYVAARSMDEALSELAKDGDAKILAGGQSLTPMLNFRLVRPSALVDINRLPNLGEVRSNGGLRIGALVRHRTIETSSAVRERQPILAAAAAQVGHLAIRNRGTFGGSIAHNDPAGEFPMVALLLDATMTATSSKGKREIAAGDFFVGYLSSSLREGEILTEVVIPDLAPNSGWGFEELCRRPGDFAIAAVAATVTLKGDAIASARISMAGVGPGPVRAATAEKGLAGQKLGDDALKGAASAARNDCDPSNDVHATADFRRHLVEVLTERALRAACDRARKAS